MTKNRRLILTFAGFIALSACLFLAVIVVSRSPLFSTTGLRGPVVRWSGLPTPRVVHGAWRSYGGTAVTNDLLLHDGLLWAGTDGGLLVWEWPLTGAEPVLFRSEHGTPGNRITSLTIGGDGRLWVGSSTGGVSSYDGVDWQPFTIADGLLANEIRDLLLTPDGELWVATSAGINVYDGRRWRAYDDARTLLQLPSTDVTTLTLAPDGAIIAGTRAGLARFTGRRWQDISPAGTAAALDVRDLTVTGDGAIWAATAGGLQRYAGESWQLFTTADGLAADTIRTVARSAVSDEILLTYDTIPGPPAQVGFESSLLTVSAAPTIAGDPVGPINAVLDTPDGFLLAAASGVLQEQADGRWRPLPAAAALPISEISEIAVADNAIFVGGTEGIAWQEGSGWALADFPAGRVTQMAVGMDGRPVAAFSHPGEGVVRFVNGAWQPLTCPITGPPSAFLRRGVRSPDGAVWFATTGGVARFQDDAWQIFGTAQGLPSTTIQDIDRDPAGNIWVGTPAGMAAYINGIWQQLNGADVRLLRIAPDGDVYYITGEEIFLLDKEGLRQLPNPPVSQVYDLAAARDGLWLGANEGLFFFDGDGWQQDNNRRTTALALGADDRLWAAQQGVQADDSHPLYGSYALGENLLTQISNGERETALLPTAVGLPHPVITGIAQAADGAIWASTLGGMARFDGADWQSFGGFDGLPSPVVYRFALNADGVWAVSKGGVAAYDGESWRQFPELNTLWPFFEDIAITADGAGAIWIGLDEELQVWRGAQWEPAPLDLPTPVLQLRFLTTDDTGTVWALAKNDGAPTESIAVGKRENGSWTWQFVDPPDPLAGGGVALFQAGPDGRLWLGNAAGLWSVDPAAPGSSPQPAGQQVRGVSALAFAADGRPIAGSAARGDLFFPTDGAAPLTIPSTAQLHIFALHTAADGGTWVGTDQGIARLDPNGAWELYPIQTRDVTQLISELAVGVDGRIWIGTYGGEVWQWDKSGDLETYPDSVAPEDIPVSVLVPTGPDTVWKGSFGASLARLDERRWERFRHTTDLFSAQVTDLAVGVDGRLWLGNDEELMALAIENGETVCRFDGGENDLLGTQLTADLQGNLWVYDPPIMWRGDGETFERALTRVQPITAVAPDGAFWAVGEAALLRVVGDDQQPLPTSDLPGPVTAIRLTPNGTVLAGTDAGLAIYSNGGWQLRTTADGLPGNRIRQITVGEDGRIWLLTDGGMAVGRP